MVMHCLSGRPLYGKKQRLFSKVSQISFVYAAVWPIICSTSGKVNNAKRFSKLIFFTFLIPIRVQGIYRHHIPVMELGHLLTRSGLTYPEVSSKVCYDSFCQLGKSVPLSWVIYLISNNYQNKNPCF
jgi:hypothetical protein